MVRGDAANGVDDAGRCGVDSGMAQGVTLKDHHTALPVPTSAAEMSSGRDFGHRNQVQLSCGWRSRSLW